MEAVEFLSLNMVIFGVIGLIVTLYLVFLIRKRRREKFLHRDPPRRQ